METFHLNQIDPLRKQTEHGLEGGVWSPMDPPTVYAPPNLEKVDLAELHPFLKKFSEEHVVFLEELKVFEEAILSIQKEGLSKEVDRRIRHFFHFFDEDFASHSRREERWFFPLLKERLLAEGEHSQGDHPTTSVDLMEDDHLKAIQLAAVVFNFFGLAFRLPDPASRLIVLDTALEQGKNLVELLRLHIFREDNVVFASAHKLISREEFDEMLFKKMAEDSLTLK